MEGFEDHMFLWRQVFLHLLARRQHDDLRKPTAGTKPACSQLAQEVRRVGRGGNAEIEEHQRGVVFRWHSPVFPGEGGLPPSTHCRAIPCQLKHPAEQFLDRWLVLGDEDARCSGISIRPCKRRARTGIVSVPSHHTASFLLA